MYQTHPYLRPKNIDMKNLLDFRDVHPVARFVQFAQAQTADDVVNG